MYIYCIFWLQRSTLFACKVIYHVAMYSRYNVSIYMQGIHMYLLYIQGALSQVRICRPPTPPPPTSQKWPYFHETCPQC